MKGQRNRKRMAYALRPIQPADVHQAQQVEKDAFPTLWPPTPFKKELNSKIARYLVAYQEADEDRADEIVPQDAGSPETLSMAKRLVGRLSSIFGQSYEDEGPRDHVVGVVGIWYMADEAHITTIGVRNTHRRNGIGELLLIGCIEQAMSRGARVVTLEVRRSNHEAQLLYKKYGFREVGLRKRYYSDNNEDALIMTTDPIVNESYTEAFSRLLQAHAKRWGESERVLK